jgi:hypothetical protein
MSLNHSPRIVTDGLVLCLDAADPKSYNGSGTTWFDRSIGRNDFSLINSPIYNGDSFSTSVTRYFNGPSSNDITGDNQLYLTLSNWVRFTDTSTNRYIVNLKRQATDSTLFSINCNNGGAGKFSALFRNRANTTHLYLNSTLSTYNDNKWHNVTIVADDTVVRLYIDGEFDVEDTSGGIQSVAGNTALANLGAFNSGSNTHFTGDIAQTLIYRKALTTGEIYQNFNAQKGRFGL